MEPGQCATRYKAGSRNTHIGTIVHKPGTVGELIVPLKARIIMVINRSSIKRRSNAGGIGTPVSRRRFLISFHRHISKIITAAGQGAYILSYYKDQFSSVSVRNIKIVEKVAFQFKLSLPNELGSIRDYFILVGSVTINRRFTEIKSGCITVFEHSTVKIHICQQGISSLFSETPVARIILADVCQIRHQRL